MRILYIADRFPILSETFVIDQISALVDRGHQVRVLPWFGSDSDTQAQILPAQLKECIMPMRRSIPKALAPRLIRGVAPLARLLLDRPRAALRLFDRRYGKMACNMVPVYTGYTLADSGWQPDVVIAHFGPNGLLASALKNAGYIPANARIYTYVHAWEISGLTVEQTRAKYSPLFDDGTILLPISNLWYDKLIAAGAMPARTHIAHMGVDTTGLAYRLRTIDADRPLNIISVGRLVEKKGHAYSIRAVSRFVKTTSRKVQFAIIGDGPLYSELTTLIDSLDAGAYIQLSGPMPHDAVKAALDKADIFMLPSVTGADGDMEGIPVSLMEAMSLGLVCVSTYHSGIPELITDHVSGYLCRERNVDDIVAVLTEIDSAPVAEIERITTAARTKVVNDFDNTRLINELNENIQGSILRSL